jgi:acetate kinase
LRAQAVEAFAFLGIRLDAAKNAQSPPDTDIATPDSAVRVLVVHTEEEWEIARESFRVAGAA